LWLVGALLLVVLWIGWAIYVAADRGGNQALGVLVAWPALLLMAAIVTAPLAALAYWIFRSVREKDEDDGSEDGDTQAPKAKPGFLAVRGGPVPDPNKEKKG
jgi:membrane protein implicated in regulation of membrane protease activity